ncbi:hypothetical protein H9P43_008982 [Blastocladiella emersonii ATCC 22665]|nr:hypothetical protein H9P43_008982 [Blastocladiella emersonii ATCC 22665]
MSHLAARASESVVSSPLTHEYPIIDLAARHTRAVVVWFEPPVCSRHTARVRVSRHLERPAPAVPRVPPPRHAATRACLGAAPRIKPVPRLCTRSSPPPSPAPPVELGGFRNEQLTSKCQFPTRGKPHADWVMYLTSDKKYRVGKLATALNSANNCRVHDVAIAKQLRIQNDAPGSTMMHKDIPVQALTLHPADPGMGFGRHYAVIIHFVPNYDRPAAQAHGGAANTLLNSEYWDWLLHPFPCAVSATLMAYLWERDLFVVV